MAEEVTPSHFYKYRSMGEAGRGRTLDIVERSRLWAAAPRSFNDPFDCVPFADFEGSIKEVRRFWKSWLVSKMPNMKRDDRRRFIRHAVQERRLKTNKFERSVQAAIDGLLDELGVISLSVKPDSVLMWSHYADSHAGICLRFSTDNYFFATAQPVSYQKARPAVRLYRSRPEEDVSQALLSKADYWAYEEEWRVVIHPPGKPGLQQFPAAALDGIILGANCTPDDRKAVEACVKARPGIELLEAKFDPTSYRLNLITISI